MDRLSLLVPRLLTVGGGVLYHLGVKAVPKSTDPVLALASAYATALCASVVAYWVVPTAPEPAPVAPWHPAILAVGLGVVMVPIGVALFDERLSAARGLGVALRIVGVLLLKR